MKKIALSILFIGLILIAVKTKLPVMHGNITKAEVVTTTKQELNC